MDHHPKHRDKHNPYLFEITKCFSSWSIFDSPQQIKKIVSIQGWGCSHCFLVKRSSLSSLTISWPEEYHHLRKNKNKNCQASPAKWRGFWLRRYPAAGSQWVDFGPQFFRTHWAPSEKHAQQLTLKTPNVASWNHTQMLRTERSFHSRTFQHGHKKTIFTGPSRPTFGKFRLWSCLKMAHL